MIIPSISFNFPTTIIGLVLLHFTFKGYINRKYGTSHLFVGKNQMLGRTSSFDELLWKPWSSPSISMELRDLTE